MEITVIAEAEQIQLQRLAFNHFNIGNIGYVYCRKIRLTRYRTQTCKFGTIELYKIVVIPVLVRKSLKYVRVIICTVFCFFAAEKGYITDLAAVSSAHRFPPFKIGSSAPLAANAAALSMQVPHFPQG